MPSIALEATRFVEVPGIEAFDPDAPDGANNVDPTALAVQFAFLPQAARPAETDWLDGEWQAGRTDTVQYLLSPLDLEMTVGSAWVIWIRISGAIETAVRSFERLLTVV